jgi:hypothetical protein
VLRRNFDGEYFGHHTGLQYARRQDSPCFCQTGSVGVGSQGSKLSKLRKNNEYFSDLKSKHFVYIAGHMRWRCVVVVANQYIRPSYMAWKTFSCQ